MNALARLSESGQITVPLEIQHRLGLKSGDKISFYTNANGEIVISNASVQAILQAQKAFKGVAEELGLHDEEDVQNLVNEVRYGKK